MIATFVAAIGLTGSFAALIQVAKMTQGALCENTATTVMQGYIEQLKSVNFNELDATTIRTRLNGQESSTLTVSTGLPPDLTTVPAGTVPAGVVSNINRFPLQNTPLEIQDDLVLDIWLWVTPLDNTSSGIGRSRRIVMIYTWQLPSLGISNRRIIHTIRSDVPTR